MNLGKVLVGAFSVIIQLQSEGSFQALVQDNPLCTREVFGIKMLENLGVGGAENGEVCFIRRGSGAQDWGVTKVDTGVREITHIDGDKERLVIGSRSDIQVGGDRTIMKL